MVLFAVANLDCSMAPHDGVQWGDVSHRRRPGAQMHALPVDDLFAKGRVREDGRLRHDFFLAEVKAPSESIAPWAIGDHFRQKRLVAEGVRA